MAVKVISERISARRGIWLDRMDRRISESGDKTGQIGISTMLRTASAVLALITLLLVGTISVTRISAEEFDHANATVTTEINYLCLQLESHLKRGHAFERVLSSVGLSTDEASNANPSDYLLLTSAIVDLFEGETLEQTGTAILAKNDVVVASNDGRVGIGEGLKECLGDNPYAAIEQSMKEQQMQKVTLSGTLADFGRGYLMGRRVSDYTVVVFAPHSLVFRNRPTIMRRESTMALIIALVILAVVDRMLYLTVVRRINRANEALSKVVNGDLEARVANEGVREFRSLAKGINMTVTALSDWIDEAESRMDAELATARAIQEGSLPRHLTPHPDIDRFDISASMDPAREVGGDFYDFFLVGDESNPDEGKIALVIADVSDKGIPAALFMMKAKALIRDYVQSDSDLAHAVKEANAQICDSNEMGMFVTAWICVLDYATGHVEYVNAGHNPPLLRQHNGDCLWLRQKSGPVLGMFPANFVAHSVRCAPGDMLVLYTDGVTESENNSGSQYGEERLLAFAEGACSLGPQAFIEELRTDVSTWADGAEQSDDITILALELRDTAGD